MLAVLLVSALAVVGYTRVVGDDGTNGNGNGNGSPGSPGAWLAASCQTPPDEFRAVVRGTVQGRTADLQFLPRLPHSFGDFRKTTHSGPWDFLQRVPLVLYGPGYIAPRGDLELARETTVADIAPTVAELLGLEFPDDRPGRAITEALVPRVNRAEPPRLIVLVVWDGAGYNVLEQWPDAWPRLARLMRRGTSVRGVEVGSSPSVTPAIHATMGTGAFPRQHGVVDIPVRTGEKVLDAFPDKAPRFLELPTVADLYDPTTNNASLVGLMAERAWHLGMMGSGAYIEGGDKDYAVMTQGGDGRFIANTDYYKLPRYLDRVPGYELDRELVDRADGVDDGLWMGHEMPAEKEAGGADPVWSHYQLRVLKALWEREGFGRDAIPDLFFTNFKEIDLVGHAYNMIEPEMESTLRHNDRVLGDLVEHLDTTVGRNRWVLALTADHGSGPDPRSIDSWPISMPQLQVDLALEYGVRVGPLFQAQRPTGMWFKPDVVRDAGIDLEDAADFLIGYTLGDNVPDGKRAPRGYRDRVDERLFAAAFPTNRIEDVASCIRARS
ncbi:MAG TPA: alkaline phosphatase family protein [Actinomycetota bacterium]|nr:alkaline phosphatase family protein [Actinomycetota bacterium]